MLPKVDIIIVFVSIPAIPETILGIPDIFSRIPEIPALVRVLVEFVDRILTSLAGF